MFQGFIQLEDTLRVVLAVKNSSNTPINLDAQPTYRIYGPDGFLVGQSGSMSFLDTGSITGATNASPIAITSASHGLTTGSRVTITGVGGNTAANGTFVITSTGTNTFTLDGSTGDGAYTSGGTWNVTGLYKLDVVASGANGFEVNTHYTLFASGEISSTAWGGEAGWGVV